MQPLWVRWSPWPAENQVPPGDAQVISEIIQEGRPSIGLRFSKGKPSNRWCALPVNKSVASEPPASVLGWLLFKMQVLGPAPDFLSQSHWLQPRNLYLTSPSKWVLCLLKLEGSWCPLKVWAVSATGTRAPGQGNQASTLPTPYTGVPARWAWGLPTPPALRDKTLLGQFVAGLAWGMVLVTVNHLAPGIHILIPSSVSHVLTSTPTPIRPLWSVRRQHQDPWTLWRSPATHLPGEVSTRPTFCPSMGRSTYQMEGPALRSEIMQERGLAGRS